MVRRIRSPVASRRPCSDDSGMSVGLATRSVIESPAFAPSSVASASLMNASRPVGVGSCDAVEAAEPIVDAVDHHLTRDSSSIRSCATAPAATMTGVTRFPARRSAVPGNVIGERGSEKCRRRDDDVGGAEPAERDLPQALAHRCADEQRAGQHRHGHGDAEHHQRVGGGVVAKAGAGEHGVL